MHAFLVAINAIWHSILLTHYWIHEQDLSFVNVWRKFCIEYLRFVSIFITLYEYLANTDRPATVP